MSNKENPCAGHLIEATKLAVFLSDDQRPAFIECLEDQDFEEALSMLDQSIPDGVACPSQIFILIDTDTGDPRWRKAFLTPTSTRKTSMRKGEAGPCSSS